MRKAEETGPVVARSEGTFPSCKLRKPVGKIYRDYQAFERDGRGEAVSGVEVRIETAACICKGLWSTAVPRSCSDAFPRPSPHFIPATGKVKFVSKVFICQKFGPTFTLHGSHNIYIHHFKTKDLECAAKGVAQDDQ